MTTIFQALASVMSDVDHVAKKDVNQQQRFTFRGIDAVVNAVGPSLRKHGVIVVPEVERYDYGTVVTTKGHSMGHARVTVAYTFYGPEGDSIRSSAPGEAFDAGDKATPKAMSVAFRTALLQALALPTDDPDPDAQTYERGSSTQPPASPTPPPPLAVAKARAWNALQKIKPDLPTDEAQKFTAAALQARGSSIGAADSTMWNQLADEWEATA